jgi:hypothetical protein
MDKNILLRFDQVCIVASDDNLTPSVIQANALAPEIIVRHRMAADLLMTVSVWQPLI